MFFAIFACENPIEHDIRASGNRYMVVEAIITNENKKHEISLHYSVPDLNVTAQAVSKAEVSVFDGTGLYTFSESTEVPGLYISDEKFIAAVNRVYYLQINHAGKSYTAASTVLPVSDFDPVGYFEKENGMYALNNIPPAFSPTENAMHKITIDWSHLPEYADSSKQETTILTYYYTLNTLDVAEFFAPETESLEFPPGAVITHRKYSLNKQHAAYVRSFLIETQWRGGFFDAEHGNTETNLSEGALGFFGTCSVIEKQVIVE